ncbi:probable COX12-cytochrome-c oxidase, subunit VIB [Armillaria ostoyae]|uniref:Cytochrome c oxidase subunit n=3 Tax=Armillaria TaxID=47424 RepID=A0A284QU60_ARMOS|nr:cytochrome c oxidase, subunit VIb [Armillaria mellea]KAK0235716.1 cytochrome c oxidase, subunit VIb [Armillaria nabsnona]KAK0450011.1 cytochrome c oxidase, subunit VIb [Armillaria borealis]PBK75463.1 cytochrome c oxidase, subunit VIb [Armillaria solidipes]SJK99987.1 probable COX12-cytochrome-c oxidase, subunit VIB [Armillaria ostoyae]
MSEASELSSKYVLQTVGFDARFPNQNQTRNCFQNYVDYFKCINAKGEDYAPCSQFKRVYRTLCPNEWVAKWDDQRETGNFPASLEP